MPENPTESERRPANSDHEISIDFTRLLTLIRRHRGKFVTVGLFSFLLGMILCATLIPQSFTSQISLSFPQAAQPTALNLLTGSGGTGSRYIGVLRSRRFAEEVERRAGVTKLCGFTSDEDAVDAIVKGLNINDNIRDSLVYVSVTLPGPPRFAPGSAPRRASVKEAAAKAANAYADVLHEYMATSDTDRDSVLLRAANEQLSRAQKAYEQAVSRLGEFVVRPRRQTMTMTTPQPEADGSAPETGSERTAATSRGGDSSGAPLSSTAAKELESLYIERGKLVADIQSAGAARQTGDQLRRGQLSRLNSLPEEDPLLANARAAVNAARMARDTASIQLGPDNPDIIRAQERLKLAEANLRKQTRAIAQRDTTEDVNAQVTLRGLLARSDAVNRLIAAAEKKAQRGLAFSQQFERRRNDVLLRLEVLKTTASQAAILSLQTISLKNRMAAVDTAKLAKSGSPNLTMFLIISICGTGMALCVLLILIALRSEPGPTANSRAYS